MSSQAGPFLPDMHMFSDNRIRLQWPHHFLSSKLRILSFIHHHHHHHQQQQQQQQQQQLFLLLLLQDFPPFACSSFVHNVQY
ncbi:hypothetical protein T4B_15355 [Trichinella pseudospiralis]|uniref:Uncharacterized protein n=1 Tax=Trichinella pseudospiralis TaxID=6337 RepID=A0A0V1IBT6_TRIPS|nr:hypothetical protein T4B_15355 [Trichinella pseudospiralis]KRZ43011.1 hypothetical protein T4C_8015 [Trichinella pseudospiralis]